MNYFHQANKNLLIYSTVILIIIPIFGIKFIIGFLSNILLLLFLIPFLLLLIIFIGFNSFKSKIKSCNNCGAFTLGLSETCTNCGADLKDAENNTNLDNKPSERTIEVKAEEIK